jgi:hypothetical protein
MVYHQSRPNGRSKNLFLRLLVLMLMLFLLSEKANAWTAEYNLYEWQTKFGYGATSGSADWVYLGAFGSLENCEKGAKALSLKPTKYRCVSR